MQQSSPEFEPGYIHYTTTTSTQKKENENLITSDRKHLKYTNIHSFNDLTA